MMTTNPDNSKEILLALLRAALAENCTPTLPPNIDWEAVRNMAERQGVGAIVWGCVNFLHTDHVLSSDQLPQKATKLQWAYSVEKQTKKYRKHEQVIKKLARILAENNIKMMILKGYGLSVEYPTPEHRSCSDIDIWLYGNHDTANKLIANRLNINIDNSRHHHTLFYVEGVMIENHYTLLDLSGHRSNRDIERELRATIQQGATTMKIDGTEIWCPSVNGHALFLLRHAASHFAAVEIVLRHIIDWGVFVKHHSHEIDWMWLRSVSRRHNMEQFMDAITVIASDICSFDISIIPTVTRRPELEQRILDDILSPEFSEKMPQQGLISIVWFKTRRWWANRWKHKLVYNESLIVSFITQSWSHILKPKGIKL